MCGDFHSSPLAAVTSIASGHTKEVAVSVSDDHFERALARLWRGVFPNAHALPHALPAGRWVGCQLTDTMVEHRSGSLRPFGQVGMARVDRGAKGGQGRVPAQRAHWFA